MTAQFDTEIAESISSKGWTYEQIGEAHDLDGENFSKFMRERFDEENDPDSTVGSNEGYRKEGSNIYFKGAMELAARIRDSDDMPELADTEETQEALIEHDLVEAA